MTDRRIDLMMWTEDKQCHNPTQWLMETDQPDVRWPSTHLKDIFFSYLN